MVGWTSREGRFELRSARSLAHATRERDDHGKVVAGPQGRHLHSPEGHRAGRVLPLLVDGGDPQGVEDFATHKLPLYDAPQAYEIFQKKQDGAIKILLQP
jgi:hypothetical protein